MLGRGSHAETKESGPAQERAGRIFLIEREELGEAMTD